VVTTKDHVAAAVEEVVEVVVVVEATPAELTAEWSTQMRKVSLAQRKSGSMVRNSFLLFLS